MNIEIWIEDLDNEFETIKLTGETANNFKVPNVDNDVGCWQDENAQGSDAFNLLHVHAVRHYIFRRPTTTGGDQAQKMSTWTQEIHIMCSQRQLRGRR